jgi:hypothetical protein
LTAIYSATRSPAVAVTVTATPALGFGVSATVPAAGAKTISTADLDHNGTTDLVVIHSGAHSLGIILGNGDGTFQPEVIYSMGSSDPSYLVIGDFNRDGRADLLTADSDGTLNLIPGNGNGTFQNPIRLLLSASGAVPGIGTGAVEVFSMEAGDLNQDGTPDLVFTGILSTGVQGVLVYFANGDGTFRAGPVIPSTDNPIRAIIADINGDGIGDVVASYGSTIGIYLGRGGGTFDSGHQTATQKAIQVAVADFNGDGILDIAFAPTGQVGILLCHADGSCGTAAYYNNTSTSSGNAELIGDFNGDGKLDVLLMNSDDQTISLLPGNGDGTFGAPSGYGLSGTPAAVVAGDFNGDGRLDVAVSHSDIEIMSGLAAGLRITSTHTGNFAPGQFPATYSLTVTNTSTSLLVPQFTVTDTLPPGLIKSGMAGDGWICDFASLTCTFNEYMRLAPGASAPSITLGVSVAPDAPSVVVNSVTATEGIWTVSAVDPTVVSALAGPALTYPANGQTGVSPSATLTWNAQPNATSYTLYLGTSPSPPLLASGLTATSYSPQLARNTTYYWRIVALTSTGGPWPSGIRSFTTTPTAVYAGSVDSTTCAAITGWAADRNSPNASLTITIKDGTTILSQFTANQYRSDVGTFLNDNGLHGFSYTVPAALHDGNPHTIHVYYEATATELPGSPKSLTCGSTPLYAGSVDSATCAGISGWAADQNRPSISITVSLWDGPTQIATTTANASRADVGTFLGDSGLHGFTLQLPSNYADGTNHSLQVHYESSSTQVYGSPFNLTCGNTSATNYTGFVDTAACSGISGWAADRNRPNQAITVTLWDGATQIASTNANGSRPDVGTFLGDNGLHGYTLQLPTNYINGAAHSLQVHFESSAAQLAGSPVSLTCTSGTPNYTGFIDSASCSGINGWAADWNRLNQPLTVSLWIGATQIAATTANGSRPDVGHAIGDNGQHGYSLPIPGAYTNGAAHSLEVHFETSTTQLSGSPVSLTCGTTPTNYAGNVDILSCSTLAGWLADRDHLNTSLSADIFDGSTLLLTTPAAGSRPDVGSAINDNGLHGFSISTPSSIKTGTAHTITVRPSGSSTVLAGPQSLTCQ